MANKPPPLPKNTGGKTSSAGLPPLPPGLGGGSSSKSKTSGSAERTVKRMLAKAPGLRKYQSYIFAAARTYKMDPVYITAVLMTEDTSGNPDAQNPSGALGLGQILDGTVGNYSNKPLAWPSASGWQSAQKGQAITRAMKTNPLFSIFYVAWRIQGALAKGMGWPRAYSVGYGAGPAAGAKAASYIPNNYTPTATNSTGGIDTTYGQSIVKSVQAQPTNPFVSYDRKTGKTKYVYQLGPHVLEYEGVPVTKSLLQRETQDKAGIGGDYYNFTGRTPNMNVVAGIMATGRNLQQIENAWIGDTKHFKNSPAGKKYMAGYQDAWAQIMGNNKTIPWELVQEAAKSDLNETEFAARLRMDGFKAQKENSNWSYLKSNEYQSRVDAYTLSYEKIYGQPLKNSGMQHLASDAALAGWDSTQWEAYLRGLPEYTHTTEYQGHALGLLNQLGMDFGFISGLGQGGYTPKNPANQLPGPPPDKRIAKGATPTPAGGNNLGITIPNA